MSVDEGTETQQTFIVSQSPQTPLPGSTVVAGNTPATITVPATVPASRVGQPRPEGLDACPSHKYGDRPAEGGLTE